MNILFVSHCDFRSNSAIQIYNIAHALMDLGEHCVVCVPGNTSTVDSIGSPPFLVRSFDEALSGVLFPNGAGPDLIHAWTPRELVRKFTEQLLEIHGCPYLVHLEDNEEVILEVELGATYAELLQLSQEHLDAIVPQSRSHPLRYPEFMASAAGVTALIERLLEFKPPHLPELVFWPGFDEECLHLPGPDTELRRRLGIGLDVTVLVYNGNIHATNAAEVRSLFLAVQALRRSGRKIVLLKAGWNSVSQSWVDEAFNSGAVIDLGFVARKYGLWNVLATADILVQPGRADRFNDYRFPAKLPEFFASGRPVILPRSNVGLTVRDGVDALVLDRGDAIEIAEKLEVLMDNPALASKIGTAGKTFALDHLNWPKNVAALRDYYTSILARFSASPRCAKPICFYLPQFHPTKDNDEFWGKGFTEWTNVRRAEPNFVGHYQPQLPADLGFYDLRLPEVLCHQAKLASEYGIYGFCFYYYWFGGRRVLDGPLTTMLQSGEPDFPFCICWANESWTRNWDGAQDQILIQQEYSGDSCERFIRDVIPIMQDRRYIRAGDAPLLLIYRADQLPDAPQVASKWRQICAEAGIPKIHLCAVQSYGIEDPKQYGFDAAVEFPPHTKRALLDTASFPGLSSDFEGYLEDYPEVVRNQIAKPWPDHPLYRGVMPAWDNTARRGKKAHILVHSSIELYEDWLGAMIQQTLEHPLQEPFVFINAWNEWAEGAYLEPDQRFGHARLRATRNALRRAAAEPQPSRLRPGIRSAAPINHPDAASGVLQREQLNGFRPDKMNRLYSDYPVKALSYGTARDYCDSFDNLSPLAVTNGDMKDLQRPWMLKAILSKLHGKSRLLEIGAGEPMVADLLQQLGHEVWIVDPYDGSGNGPTEYDAYRNRYPKLKFLRSVFNDQLRGIEDASLDCIYSISVLEHIPCAELVGVFAGMKRFLKPSGLTIHAIDHVHKGNGAEQHLKKLRRMIQGFGFRQEELDELLATMADDVETYYLSSESHNRWRGSVPYDQFPMRVCVSVQVVREADALER